MAGYAIDDRGREFVAIVTVEQRTNAVTGLDAFDMTHAISGRQKRSKQVDTKSQGINPSMLAFKISIADLLEAVKSTYRSILSTDVLNNLRNKNELGTTVGVTNNLRSLAASIKFIDDFVAPVNDDVKQRFSYAGERAETADLDALERAKEMQAAGVADETIRQETGWFTGMDGKWRWEIDDSGMERPETVSENL